MVAAFAAAPRLSDGPPPGHTGGFGEPTCTACHQPGEPRNGSVVLEGMPVIYVPGSRLDFDVVTRGQGLTRAGFQLSVRFASGPHAGRQAGTLSVGPDPLRTSLTTDSTLRVLYAHHTLEGTRGARDGVQRWRLRWTAPQSMDSVVFHVSSVIASDDNSPLDDEVRTAVRGLGAGIP